ncbi:hypothetical protein [Sphingomonas sp.]|uniref:hypothetical protein n=1 Tax=Sphingomonas sp. TaxID=28214 RepID=UPI003D6D2875
MDSQFPQPDPTDDPATAFAALRGEVSLLRRAVEGLTAERQDAPDYTATLDATANRLAEIGTFMRTIADRPAMKFTPDSFAAEMVQASAKARAGDRDNLDRASAALKGSITSIDGIVEKAWTADRQNRWLVGAVLAGAIAGIILWSVLPGEIARALPARWNVPERMAARLMRLDMNEAGQRLIMVARRRNAGAPVEAQPQTVEPTSPVPASPALRRP